MYVFKGKNGCIGLFFSLFCASANAQQLPLFTQYREYTGVLNPAAISSDYFLDDYKMNFGLSVRSQWRGVAKNPKTQLLRGEWFNKRDYATAHLVVGGWLMNDQTGATGTTSAAGRIGVLVSDYPEQAGVSAGISLGMGQFRFDASSVALKNPNDPLGEQDFRQFYPDVALGIYGYGALSDRNNYLYGGVSLPQAFAPDLLLRTSAKTYSLNRVRHYYAQLGFCQFLEDRSFWEASAWLRYVPTAPLSIDINVRYRLKNILWLGAGYSTARNLHVEMGFVFETDGGPAFKIGYGYDSSFNNNLPYFGASHEVNISVLLD